MPALLVPAHFVQATRDHANALHEKHSKQGVQAYAKLAGKEWTFYIKRLKNNIGRPPEGGSAVPLEKQPAAAHDLPALSPEEDLDDNGVHVDLGPSKMVSRLHAQIFFDADAESWNIKVLGRNGIRINHETIRRAEEQPLISGQVIEIGGVEMMFVLPEKNGSLQIHSRYLHRAGLIETEGHPPENGASRGPASSATTSSASQLPSRGQNAGPLLAPAPPDYQRPGTPVSARSKVAYSAGKSPAFAGGTMLMNTDDVDLSLASNKHIKPSYSYAQLISQAILDTDDEKLTLNGIYNFIMARFAYYRYQTGGGWQVSQVRVGSSAKTRIDSEAEFDPTQSILE